MIPKQEKYHVAIGELALFPLSEQKKSQPKQAVFIEYNASVYRIMSTRYYVS